MTGFEAVALWIGLHVLLLLGLKLNVGRVRNQTDVGFGDGGNETMLRAIRVQGNAVEDVPISLLGLGALALLDTPILLLHILGGSLLASRILHATGLGSKEGFSLGRFVGTIGSMLCLLVIGGACLWYAVV